MAKIETMIYRKVKGSTILEVVIAMVVMVFVIGIAFMILANVTRLSLSARKLKTDGFLQSRLSEISAEQNIRDTTFTLNDISIEKTVKKNDLGDNLYTIDLKATDKNAVLIAEVKGIIAQNHDH